MSLYRTKLDFHPTAIFTQGGLFMLVLVALLLGGCNEEVSVFEQKSMPPVVSSFSPMEGAAGTDLTIMGDFLTDVDSVKIGGVLAQIKYRVSKNELIVNVLPECKTGTVVLRNSSGWTESSEVFTMEYAVPTLSTIPAIARVNDEIELRGTKLNAVHKVYFREAGGTDVEATILYQRVDELIVEVPYFSGENAKIVLSYLKGSEAQTVVSDNDFSLSKPIPSVTNSPAEAQVNTTVELKGENLTVVDKVMVGQYQAQIVTRTNNAITFIVPGEFEASASVPLKVVFYGGQEVVISTSFSVVVGEIAKVLFWEARTIQCQVDDAESVFFNPKIGYSYAPCEYEANRDNIYFYVTWSGSSKYIQLNNPNNSANQAKNFKCEGANLPTELLPNIVKFRILDATDETQLALKNKVINKEILEITDETWAGVPQSSVNTPRFYPSPTAPGSNEIVIGDVVMFQRFLAEEVVETGFIHVTDYSIPDFTVDPNEGKKAVVTFNCYFQK